MKKISNILMFIILPVFINIVIESLAHKSLLGGIEQLIHNPYIFLCNTLIIAFTLSIGIFFRRYRYFWITIISLSWILLGISNFLLLCNRVLPLTAHDLQLLDLASAMMHKYLNPFTAAIVSMFIIILMIGIIILFIRAQKPKGKYGFIQKSVFFFIMFAITFGALKYGTTSSILETHFAELPKSYLKNGFAYSFSLSLLDNGIDTVDGYSEELIESITKEFDVPDKANIKTPSIVFLQLESFFDVNSLNSITFSENPIPNFTKLMSENGSGLLTVPIIGAGTVNTEFEVVTGMRILDFGAGEYPYKTILTDHTCESIANNLKNHGYASHFIHNYKGTFYGRNNVYANLGYDFFNSIEYMSGYETNENGWAKDDILIRYIRESLETTDGPDLVTAISVQAHGDYGEKTDFERHITVNECKYDSLKTSYEYYINQIYEVDKFIGELVETLKQMDEDIILVAYGDHLPSLDLTNSDVNNRTIYQSDYFIWNNIGIDFKDEDLYAYQVSSKVLEAINITDGVINACHQEYKDDSQYIYNLQALEYDTLYGKKYAYNGKNPYSVSAMKENSRTLKIHDVVKKENEEYIYVVTGNGFTDNSFVRVGNRIVFTNYIDEHTLEFKWKNHDATTPITVWEKDIGNSEIFLDE